MTPVVPANFPPPFDPADYVKRPDGPADLRIECGIAIVGAGPAGLACAIRLGQLLGDDPATLEQLGEVPIIASRRAVRPARTSSPARSWNPSALRELFGETPLEQLPTYGPVTGEGVYFMTRSSGSSGCRRRRRSTTRATGSSPSRGLDAVDERAGRGAARRGSSSPRATALRLLTEEAPGGRVRRAAPAPMGLDRGGGRPRPARHRRRRSSAKATVLAEGTQGHLPRRRASTTRASARVFPQAYEIGVKEVWKVPVPLDRIIHTLGVAAAVARQVRGGRRLVHLPDGRRAHVRRIRGGPRVRGHRLSLHDLLQRVQDSHVRRRAHGGRRARRLGRKTIPTGGYWSIPELALPGAVLDGRRGRAS